MKKTKSGMTTLILGVGVIISGVIFIFVVWFSILPSLIFSTEESTLKSMPKFPEATIWNVILHKGSWPDDATQTAISFDTNAGPDDTLAFYNKYLKDNGWTLETSDTYGSEFYEYYTRRTNIINYGLRVSWGDSMGGSRRTPCCRIVMDVIN